MSAGHLLTVVERYAAAALGVGKLVQEPAGGAGETDGHTSRNGCLNATRLSSWNMMRFFEP
jgi:hypothetical protein